jgi:hypothetical protein
MEIDQNPSKSIMYSSKNQSNGTHHQHRCHESHWAKARNRLNELCELGLLTRQGKARATCNFHGKFSK